MGVGSEVVDVAAVCESISYGYAFFGFRIVFQIGSGLDFGDLVEKRISTPCQSATHICKYKILKPDSESGNGMFLEKTFANAWPIDHFWSQLPMCIKCECASSSPASLARYQRGVPLLLWRPHHSSTHSLGAPVGSPCASQ